MALSSVPISQVASWTSAQKAAYNYLLNIEQKLEYIAVLLTDRDWISTPSAARPIMTRVSIIHEYIEAIEALDARSRLEE